MRPGVIEGQLPQVLDLIKVVIDSAAREEFRCQPRDFSRDGILDPTLLVTLVLFMVGDGNRRGYRWVVG